MISVWIPAPLRTLCGDAHSLEVEGATLGEVLRNLDTQCPGFYDRVVQDGRIRPELAIALGGEIVPVPLHERLTPGTEIAIVTALGGG